VWKKIYEEKIYEEKIYEEKIYIDVPPERLYDGF
jgi:hypothetical protein